MRWIWGQKDSHCWEGQNDWDLVSWTLIRSGDFPQIKEKLASFWEGLSTKEIFMELLFSIKFPWITSFWNQIGKSCLFLHNLIWVLSNQGRYIDVMSCLYGIFDHSKHIIFCSWKFGRPVNFRKVLNSRGGWVGSAV